MKKKFKHAIFSLAIFLSSGIYFFLAYKGYNSQNIELDALEKFTGIITNRGIVVRQSGKNEADVFFVKIAGLNETLGVYRMRREYDDLVDKFRVGAEVTVFYQRGSQTEDVNIDLIRAESKGVTLLSEEEWKSKESALIYIGILAGIFSVGMSVWYFRKYVK